MFNLNQGHCSACCEGIYSNCLLTTFLFFITGFKLDLATSPTLKSPFYSEQLVPEVSVHHDANQQRPLQQALPPQRDEPFHGRSQQHGRDHHGAKPAKGPTVGGTGESRARQSQQ